MFKTSSQIIKHLMKGDLENHSKDQWFRLGPWQNIIQFLRKTSQDSINLARKCYLEYSLDTHCVREEFGKEVFWSQTLRNLEKHGRVRSPCSETRCKGDNAEKWWTFLRKRRWNSQVVWRRSGDPKKSDEALSDDVQGSSDGTQSIDATMDDREVRNDFCSIEGSCIHRHHVEPGVQLYVPKEEGFPIPLRYIDVIRRTRATSDMLQENRIDDYRNVDGGRNLSDPWASSTQFIVQWRTSFRFCVVWGTADKNSSIHKAWSSVAIDEAHESTRKCLERTLLEDHEGHIAGKGFNSLSLYFYLVRKFIPVLQAMKIKDAKLEKLLVCHMTKVKGRREVILEAQKRAKNSPFWCADGHLSSQEGGVRNEVSKTKVGLCCEVTQWKTILALMLYSQSKVSLHLKWRP